MRVSPVDPYLVHSLNGIGYAFIELRRFDEAILHRSVPYIFSIANSARASDCRHFETGGVEGFLVAQDAPRDPRQFVCQGRCQLVAV
jgi:hypothetical protein